MQVYTPGLTTRELSLQWRNMIVHFHDIICKCNSPLEHTIDNIICNEPNLRLPESTKKQLQKCLSGTADTGADAAADDGLQDGDLEALFADTDENDTG